MGKYDSLTVWLQKQNENELSLIITELEEILGFTLPESAFKHSRWWMNDIQHSQAKAWLNAGYRVINYATAPTQRKVVFIKCDSTNASRKAVSIKDQIEDNAPTKPTMRLENIAPKKVSIFRKFTSFFTSEQNEKLGSKKICGHIFNYIQTIKPDTDCNGKIIEYAPQSQYNNVKKLPLLYHGSGAFCRFQLNCEAVAGVYLWVVGNEIIYIGETNNFKRRFNQGYGIIHPRNCFFGGQSTNCKMNKAVLDLYKDGNVIDIYFLKTDNYKQVELQLLRQINTKFNAKDNS